MDTAPVVHDQTLTLNGLRFHYREWGEPDTPPLVLLHAYTQHARTWDTVARALARRFRVLVLDQRGHGESEWTADYGEQRLVDDLEAFVDALGLDRFRAAGFSIGSAAACGFAARHPDRVERLVLIECFTDGDEPEALAHLTTLRGLPDSFASPQEATVAFRPLAPFAAEEELRHWMASGLVQEADGRFRWRYDAVFHQYGPPGRLVPAMAVFWERLRQVTCPILLVVGEGSWMVEAVQQMVSGYPRARLTIVPDAGHWVSLDNPQAFLQVLEGFLTESD
jgi:pimeloyl-ACP methyl ester carboxylesterase